MIRGAGEAHARRVAIERRVFDAGVKERGFWSNWLAFVARQGRFAFGGGQRFAFGFAFETQGFDLFLA